MRKILPLLLVANSALTAATLQQWNFAENSSGVASLISDQGLATSFFGTNNTEIPSDGGYTVNRPSGTSGNLALGAALSDANTRSITLSVTLASFDFSAGTTDASFSVRLRDDSATPATVADLGFSKQTANTRIRLTGTAVAGVAIGAVSSTTPITYGLTLDLVNNTYTYWIGTPGSTSSTWVSRFAAHTGTIASLGATSITQLQWSWANVTTGNTFVLDKVDISYEPLVTAPVDTDGDGMTDSYETANGLNPNSAGDALLDPDNDGRATILEYLLGRDPNVAEPLSLDLDLRSGSAAGRLLLNYRDGVTSPRVEYATSLGGAWTPVASAATLEAIGCTIHAQSSAPESGNGITQRSYEFTCPPATPAIFFRIAR